MNAGLTVWELKCLTTTKRKIHLWWQFCDSIKKKVKRTFLAPGDTGAAVLLLRSFGSFVPFL